MLSFDKLLTWIGNLNNLRLTVTVTLSMKCSCYFVNTHVQKYIFQSGYHQNANDIFLKFCKQNWVTRDLPYVNFSYVFACRYTGGKSSKFAQILCWHSGGISSSGRTVFCFWCHNSRCIVHCVVGNCQSSMTSRDTFIYKTIGSARWYKCSRITALNNLIHKIKLSAGCCTSLLRIK